MGNLTNMEKIEKSIKKLESINQWISNCDTKSSFILTFYGVVLTIIFTSSVGEKMLNTFSLKKSGDFSKESVVNFFLLILTVAFFSAAMKTFFHIYLTLKGRIDPKIYSQNGLKRDSNIFFGSIASKSFENFENDSNNEDEIIYLNDLNSQTFINANIVTEKFRHYNKSLLWMFFSLSLFLAFIILK